MYAKSCRKVTKSKVGSAAECDNKNDADVFLNYLYNSHRYCIPDWRSGPFDEFELRLNNILILISALTRMEIATGKCHLDFAAMARTRSDFVSI